MRVLVISADNFEDSELNQPVEALARAGVAVDIASLEAGTITGKEGGMVQANLAVTGADPEDYDLLLLPGGKAPAALRRSDAVLDLARTFATQGKPIAAICHGPQILISAGLAQGRQMTGYKSVAAELDDAGAYYLDQPLVSDGNFITARQPQDLPIFVDAVLGALDLRPNAR